MGPSKLHQKGRFWPLVRAMIWEKAEELRNANYEKADIFMKQN